MRMFIWAHMVFTRPAAGVYSRVFTCEPNRSFRTYCGIYTLKSKTIQVVLTLSITNSVALTVYTSAADAIGGFIPPDIGHNKLRALISLRRLFVTYPLCVLHISHPFSFSHPPTYVRRPSSLRHPIFQTFSLLSFQSLLSSAICHYPGLCSDGFHLPSSPPASALSLLSSLSDICCLHVERIV